jgi:hypothetical protein
MTDERDKIAGRIRALLAKTVENGCTEEEALSAARLAASLLAKYNMKIDEATVRENRITQQQHVEEDIVGERLWKVAREIAELTGSRYWRSRAGVHPIEITFFGFEHEVAIAAYLLEICARATREAADSVWRENALLVLRKRRAAMVAFVDGMIDRLAERLAEMRPPAAESSGRDLVPLRNQLIDDALARNGLTLDRKRERGSRDFDLNYLFGAAAGDRVRLNKGVTGDRDSAKRIR